MSLHNLLKEKRAERKKLAEQTSEMIVTASKEKRAMTPEEDAKWNERHADIDKLAAEIEKIEKQIQTDAFMNARVADTRTAGREDISHADAAASLTNGDLTEAQKKQRAKWEGQELRAWCAGGVNALNAEQRAVYQATQQALQNDPELRALSDVTGNLGFYTVPQGFQYQLEIATKWHGGIVQAARYLDTEMGNLLPYPSINDTTNTGEGPLAENSAVAGATGGGSEQDPTYGVVNFSAYMHDSSIVLVPLQLLQDSAFDVETYLRDLLAIRIGRRMNNLATVGTGSSQPTGVVVAASLGKTGASPTSISYNEILDLEHSLDPSYRGGDQYGEPKAAFMFADSTLKAVKKLTDSNSRPLWLAGGVSEGVQGGRPDRFDGFKYYINQDMAALGNSNKSLLFGDFAKFIIRRVRGIQMVRFGERFMDKLQIGLLAYCRFDSNIVDAGTHPIVYFANSAT